MAHLQFLEHSLAAVEKHQQIQIALVAQVEMQMLAEAQLAALGVMVVAEQVQQVPARHRVLELYLIFQAHHLNMAAAAMEPTDQEVVQRDPVQEQVMLRR
jgi:hypothetical protein